MKAQKFSQFGTFSVLVFIPLTLIFAFMTIFEKTRDGEQFYLYLSLSIVMLLALINFYKLTISIDEEKFTFKLGIGLIKRSYPLSRIKACKPVKNSWIYGIGIRLIPNGWLFNVSGLQAVELKFNDRSSVIRVGTDKSVEVSEAVSKRLANHR